MQKAGRSSWTTDILGRFARGEARFLESSKTDWSKGSWVDDVCWYEGGDEGRIEPRGQLSRGLCVDIG